VLIKWPHKDKEKKEGPFGFLFDLDRDQEGQDQPLLLPEVGDEGVFAEAVLPSEQPLEESAQEESEAGVVGASGAETAPAGDEVEEEPTAQAEAVVEHVEMPSVEEHVETLSEREEVASVSNEAEAGLATEDGENEEEQVATPSEEEGKNSGDEVDEAEVEETEEVPREVPSAEVAEVSVEEAPEEVGVEAPSAAPGAVVVEPAPEASMAVEEQIESQQEVSPRKAKHRRKKRRKHKVHHHTQRGGASAWGRAFHRSGANAPPQLDLAVEASPEALVPEPVATDPANTKEKKGGGKTFRLGLSQIFHRREVRRPAPIIPVASNLPVEEEREDVPQPLPVTPKPRHEEQPAPEVVAPQPQDRLSPEALAPEELPGEVVSESTDQVEPVDMSIAPSVRSEEDVWGKDAQDTEEPVFATRAETDKVPRRMPWSHKRAIGPVVEIFDDEEEILRPEAAPQSPPLPQIIHEEAAVKIKEPRERRQVHISLRWPWSRSGEGAPQAKRKKRMPSRKARERAPEPGIRISSSPAKESPIKVPRKKLKEAKEQRGASKRVVRLGEMAGRDTSPLMPSESEMKPPLPPQVLSEEKDSKARAKPQRKHLSSELIMPMILGPLLMGLVAFVLLPRFAHLPNLVSELLLGWGLAMGVAVSVARYNKGRDVLSRFTMKTFLRRRLYQISSRRPAQSREGVGLDIGTTHLRAALVQGGALQGVVARELPTGIVAQGLVRDRARLAAEVAALCQDAPFPMKEVNFAVTNRQVIMRLMSLSASVLEEDIELAVTSNADSILQPMDISDATVDYHELSRTGQKRTLQLAAAENEMVRAYVSSLAGGGIGKVSCEIGPLAEARALVIPREVGSLHLLINIGHGTTTLICASGSDIFFKRILPFGGKDFTAAIARNLNCSQDEAEDLKLRSGLEPMPADPALRGDPRLARCQSSLQLMTDRLIQNLDEALRAFQIEPVARPIGGLTLIGGGARLRGLAQQIATFTRTQALAPVPRPGINLTQDLDLYATAIGLASGRQMDLTPTSSGRRSRKGLLSLVGLGLKR